MSSWLRLHSAIMAIPCGTTHHPGLVTVTELSHADHPSIMVCRVAERDQRLLHLVRVPDSLAVVIRCVVPFTAIGSRHFGL
jgi:hypothetical protein